MRRRESSHGDERSIFEVVPRGRRRTTTSARSRGCPEPRRRDPRAGFTLVEVLAALAVTGLFVAVALPYAGRLATRWWSGEQAVEGADGWMQAVNRMGADLAEAVPYGLGEGGAGAAFAAGPDGVRFVRRALGDAPGLEAVSYEVRPGPGGSALVRRSRRFDPASFEGGVGGATATLLDGPFRLRIVEVAQDGARRRGWAPADGMPAAVELSAEPLGRAPVPAAPVLMPIAARAPAAAQAGSSAPK